MDDLRLELRAKNNVLWHAIHDTHPTVAEFCRAVGVDYVSVVGYLNLSRSPYRERPPLTLKSAARKLCDATGIASDELWPPRLYDGQFTARVRIAEVSSVALLAARPSLALPPTQERDLLWAEQRRIVAGAMDTLTPRQRKVVSLYFGLDGDEPHTLAEIAGMFGLCVERVRQVQIAAMDKMRRVLHRRRIDEIGDAWIDATPS